MGNPLWLIARRTFAEGWVRLTATLLAAVGAIALVSASMQFALRSQEAVAGSDASEYAGADVLVQGGTVDPADPFAPPDGRVRLDALAAKPGVAAAAGDATIEVTAARSDGQAIMAAAEGRTLLRPWVAEPRLSAYRLEAGRAPEADGEVALIRHLARAGELNVGDTMTLTLPRETRQVRVTGIVNVQDRGAVAAGDLVLAPPETVRRAAMLPPGGWQSVWLKAAPGVTAERLRDELARELGDTATVRTAASVRAAQSEATAGEGASVAAIVAMLASVAIFVGLFVVANTFGTLVRQRTRRLALLGAIGATPRQIGRLIRLEALVLGAVAAVGGVAAGFPTAELIIWLFAREGFDVSASDPRLGVAALGLPALAGILITQAAAWRAARRAQAVSPIEALRSTVAEPVERRLPRLLLAGGLFALALLPCGLAVLIGGDTPGTDRMMPTTMMILVASMLAVTGLAVLSPLFVGPLGGLVVRIGKPVSGETGRLARATITRSPRRIASATSSLMLGVALVTSLVLVTLSVNDRFAEAGQEVMVAEHAITSTARTAEGTPAPLSRDAAAKVANAPGVTASTLLTRSEVTLVSPGRGGEPYQFMVSGAEQAGLREVLRLGGRPPVLRDGEIALSSTVMRERGLRRGQEIVVRGRQGRIRLKIAGTYHDPSHVFADEALVAPATMDRIDSTAAAHAVLVRGGSAQALRSALAGTPGVEVLGRDAYVTAASQAHTRPLRATYSFAGMALLLALFGMATTVSLSVFERTREFGLLRAVGATMRQIRGIVRWEAATVALLGTLLGLVIGIGAVGLLHAVSGSSFLRPAPPWWLFPVLAAGAAVAALVTSALPARRAAGVPVLEATRAE
ncbi:FtsX-like permease family protein [Nonomuraea sp. NPDC049309]|uniref:FtsX-like permease family protein n=1 Tax=Nonomuraea sp. NPDC049309 TaxID=3364350 RepID=UPI00371D5113